MVRIGVIGGGPGGIAAAVQLAREGFEAFLFERRELGGLVANANLVENYPGFPEGIPGPQLARRLREQLENHPVVVIKEEVLWAGGKDGEFEVRTPSGDWKFAALIAAPGTAPKSWEVPVPEGVSVFAEVRDMVGFSDAFVAVVGAGDAAFDYSLTLAQWGNRVLILGRSRRPKCLPLLKERVFANPRIDFWPNARVVEVEPGTTLNIRREGRTLQVRVDAVLLAIGRFPNLAFLDKSLLRENFKLFHLVGDAALGKLGQVAIAAGQGLSAALKVSKVLRK